jgi:hypothetical protein
LPVELANLVMKEREFVVTPFTNPSGEIVFRLSGWENGRRIRKNFATRAEAEAERSIREIARLQSASGIRVAATRLSDAQLHEAESGFALLKDKPQSLLFHLDFALKTYRALETEKPLAVAITAYVAQRARSPGTPGKANSPAKVLRDRLR